MRIIAIIILLLGWAIPVQAEGFGFNLTVCWLGGEDYQFGIVGEVDSWGFNYALAYNLDALTATGDGTEFFATKDGNTQGIFGYPDVPPCAEDDVWQPDAPSIPVPLDSDCAFVEIIDPYGHWSIVTSDG